jgi:hypothetical protein
MILIFMVDGARAESSFCMRSAMPGNIVVLRKEKWGHEFVIQYAHSMNPEFIAYATYPPDRTTLL